LAFLKHLAEKYAEPVMENSDYIHLTFFACQEDVFTFFITGFHNGIQGDFDGLVKLNYDSPPSQDYFKRLWNNYFPKMLTESDRYTISTL